MNRIPAQRNTRKRTKIVHRYLVGSVGSPQFYVEDYVSARLFLVYVPDDYSADLPGIERFTLGRRLFEVAPSYKKLHVERRGASVSKIGPAAANVLHVPVLDIELSGKRIIRLGNIDARS
jgi:hypothetical protein